MKRSFPYLALLGALSFASCTVRQATLPIASQTQDMERIIQTLASDTMRGRSALVPEDIGKAADFIASEFKAIGLAPYAEQNYRQSFEITQLNLATQEVLLNGQQLSAENVLIQSSQPAVNWNQNAGIPILKITSEEDFSQRFRAITQQKKDAIVLIDPTFEATFRRFQKILGKGKIVEKLSQGGNSIVFILAKDLPTDYQIKFSNNFKKIPLFNVAGVLPGKSKAHEFVIFSGHYDHIGILEPVGQDSIANGADDDASGVTAIISLAKHFKKAGNNERTLIFVAFTGEEIGMYGSKYFSNHINADDVTAMINIEMIGKDAKFGENSLYVTGFNQSNLATLMQQEVANSKFKFFPDPYPTQQLFYRSDNAILAALGVPAHTFSTVQIDQDDLYHTVKDEVSTLNIKNIASSIEAIALGTKGIVEGKVTPSRVEKLKD